MAWTNLTKAIDIAGITPHAASARNLIGRAPGIPTVRFSPLAFFGAAARCNYLNAINPSIVTPEAEAMAALVGMFIDDTNPNFAILPSAGKIKDFAKSYFIGTVAQALAYLVMIDDGYTWCDHFESLGGGFPLTRKTPDFVFAGRGQGVALVEAKGSRRKSLASFDRTIADGYIDQVECHLGYPVGGITATHGYSIGAYLRSTTKAELRIHHTAAPVTGGGSGGSDPTSITTVQRGNYATAFTLAHSAELGQAVRLGVPQSVSFAKFEWQGTSWVTFDNLAVRSDARVSSRASWADAVAHQSAWYGPLGSGLAFALEATIAENALRHFFAEKSGDETPLIYERFEVGEDHFEEGSGVVFPDGLAVFEAGEGRKFSGRVLWDADSDRFFPPLSDR